MYVYKDRFTDSQIDLPGNGTTEELRHAVRYKTFVLKGLWA